MAVIEFTKDDVGKAVLDADGNQVGRIVDTEGGTGFVEPDPNVVETIRSKLGWEDRDRDEGEYRLDGDDVTAVTDDTVRLAPMETK